MVSGADAVGYYGAIEARALALDFLSRHEVLFELAYCSAPLTLPSQISILSGQTHGVNVNGHHTV